MSRRRGFSLVEMLVSILIAVIVAVAMYQGFVQNAKEIERVRRTAVVTYVNMSVRRLARMPAAIRSAMRETNSLSAYVNPDLRGCLLESDGVSCANDGVWHDLTLYDPIFYEGTTPFVHSTQISVPWGVSGGTFDALGLVCTSGNCPIQVRTRFRIACPSITSELPKWLPDTDMSYVWDLSDQPTCDQAESIEIGYEMRPTPGFTPEYFFNPIVGSVTISARCIVNDMCVNDP